MTMPGRPSDAVWDEMSLARDVKVMHVASDDKSHTYMISFRVLLDNDTRQTILKVGSRKNKSVHTLIREYVKQGMKLFFSDDDQDQPSANVKRAA